MNLGEITNTPRLSNRLSVFKTLASELTPNAPTFVSNKPLINVTRDNTTAQLTWDNSFNYEFDTVDYFICVYNDNDLVKTEKITSKMYQIIINNLDNSKNYTFVLYFQNKQPTTKNHPLMPLTPPRDLNTIDNHFPRSQNGGGNYEQKYLKYKNKYLQLKKLKK